MEAAWRLNLHRIRLKKAAALSKISIWPGIDPRARVGSTPGSSILLSAAVFLGVSEGFAGPGAPGKGWISAVGTQSCAAEKTATQKVVGASRTRCWSTTAKVYPQDPARGSIPINRAGIDPRSGRTPVHGARASDKLFGRGLLSGTALCSYRTNPAFPERSRPRKPFGYA